MIVPSRREFCFPCKFYGLEVNVGIGPRTSFDDLAASVLIPSQGNFKVIALSIFFIKPCRVICPLVCLSGVTATVVSCKPQVCEPTGLNRVDSLIIWCFSEATTIYEDCRSLLRVLSESRGGAGLCNVRFRAQTGCFPDPMSKECCKEPDESEDF